MAHFAIRIKDTNRFIVFYSFNENGDVQFQGWYLNMPRRCEDGEHRSTRGPQIFACYDDAHKYIVELAEQIKDNEERMYTLSELHITPLLVETE